MSLKYFTQLVVVVDFHGPVHRCGSRRLSQRIREDFLKQRMVGNEKKVKVWKWSGPISNLIVKNERKGERNLQEKSEVAPKF